MRTSVTVDNITLTKEQVTKAWEALNAPEPVVFVAGDLVRHPGLGETKLVLTGAVEGLFDARYSGHRRSVDVHVTDGRGSWTWPVSIIKKVGNLYSLK